MSDLGRDLTALLNRYSQENGSDTPDFILADYLLACLATWNTQVVRRDQWYGTGRCALGTNTATTGEDPQGPTP